MVWAALQEPRLSRTTELVLRDLSCRKLISAVSVAELAIKVAAGKLILPDTPLALCRGLGAEIVALEAHHANAVAALPLIHRDPFDRLLIAQAMVDDLTLITGDPIVASYPGVKILKNS